MVRRDESGPNGIVFGGFASKVTPLPATSYTAYEGVQHANRAARLLSLPVGARSVLGEVVSLCEIPHVFVPIERPVLVAVHCCDAGLELLLQTQQFRGRRCCRVVVLGEETTNTRFSHLFCRSVYYHTCRYSDGVAFLSVRFIVVHDWASPPPHVRRPTG